MTRYRRIMLLAVCLMLLLPSGSRAQTGSGCAGVVRPLTPYAKETITVSSTALGFTTATMVTGSLSPAAAQVTTETDSIRYYADGSTPSSTVGHLLTANSTMLVCGPAIGRLRMIRVTNDVTATVTYYAQR